MSMRRNKALGCIQRFRQRLSRDDNGATAVEFGLVCLPFMMLLFGIMSVCFYFFKTYTVENAVWTATRDMRTGAYQTASSSSAYAGITDPLVLKRKFKEVLCSKAFLSTVDCTNDVRILVQARSNFSTIATPACLAGGNLVSEASAEASFDSGGASSVVLVTACYQWTFANKMPFLKFSNMTNGARLIQGSASFRSEPYN